MSTDSQAARRLYSRSYQGILSTLSREIEGHPFGSVVAFAPDCSGLPIILISDLAEHTRNIDRDPRVSLTLTEGGDDLQAGGRITLVGRAVRVPQAQEENVAVRYFRRFPHAGEYRRAHDFVFYRIEVEKIRYIGGFGRIYWIEPSVLCLTNPFSETEESAMVSHMNNDHADALNDYCRLFGIETGKKAPKLTAIDGEGFDLMLGKRLARIDFDARLDTSMQVRKAMVELVKRAREAAAPEQRREA